MFIASVSRIFLVIELHYLLVDLKRGCAPQYITGRHQQLGLTGVVGIELILHIHFHFLFLFIHFSDSEALTLHN